MLPGSGHILKQFPGQVRIPGSEPGSAGYSRTPKIIQVACLWMYSKALDLQPLTHKVTFEELLQLQ